MEDVTKEETKDLLEVSRETEDEKEIEVEKPEDKEEEPEKEIKEDESDEEITLDQVRENIRKHEDELKEEREEIAFYETKLQSVQEGLTKDLPDIVANGKSIYQMTPEEFEEIIDQTYQAHDKAEAAKRVAEARQSRKTYLEQAKKYAPAADKFQKDAEAFRAKEWNLAQKELEALYPGIGQYADVIKEKAIKELNANPVLVDRVNQGVVAKFRYLMNLVKSEGIETKLTKADLKKEQGNREKASAGKGKSSSASESRETAYTPERIKKMSLEEYRAHKDKIYAASLKAKK